RIKGVLRIAPVLLPQWVTRTTGKPVSRSVVPLVPPLLSYSSTCSRTQSRGLGIYLAMGTLPCEVRDRHDRLEKYVARRTTLLASSHARHSRYSCVSSPSKRAGRPPS